MRGLKLYPIQINSLGYEVAPPAGAWIETDILKRLKKDGVVAPPAGAWIETISDTYKDRVLTSHPLRVRGLKH